MRRCESSAAGTCRIMKENRRENGELIVFVQWSRPVVSMLQSRLPSHWVASRISWRLSEGWTIRASSSSSTLSILSSIFNNTASSRVFFCSTGRCRLFLLLLFRLIHFPRNTASEAGETWRIFVSNIITVREVFSSLLENLKLCFVEEAVGNTSEFKWFFTSYPGAGVLLKSFLLYVLKYLLLIWK